VLGVEVFGHQFLLSATGLLLTALARSKLALECPVARQGFFEQHPVHSFIEGAIAFPPHPQPDAIALGVLCQRRRKSAIAPPAKRIENAIAHSDSVELRQNFLARFLLT
jgi:hypothetical protein